MNIKPHTAPKESSSVETPNPGMKYVAANPTPSPMVKNRRLIPEAKNVAPVPSASNPAIQIGRKRIDSVGSREKIDPTPQAISHNKGNIILYGSSLADANNLPIHQRSIPNADMGKIISNSGRNSPKIVGFPPIVNPSGHHHVSQKTISPIEAKKSPMLSPHAFCLSIILWVGLVLLFELIALF